MVAAGVKDKWTKEDEIQALREFVNQLPKDSYLMTMLKDVPSYCELQIKMDFAPNIIDEMHECMDKARRYQAEMAALRLALDKANENLGIARAEAADLKVKLAGAQCEARDRAKEVYDLKALLEQVNYDVTLLKAKVYDLLKEKGLV